MIDSEITIDSIDLNTEDIKQIEFIRRFLTSIRNESINKYSYKNNEALLFSVMSYIIGYLADRIILIKEKERE